MAHLSQIDPQAIFDDERRQLRITGTTDFKGPPQGRIVAIHFTVKQAAGGPRADTAAYVKLPYRCLGLPAWMARFSEQDFDSGQATVSAIAVSYRPDGGSLETLVWSQTIDILLDRLEAEATDMDRFYPRSGNAAAKV